MKEVGVAERENVRIKRCWGRDEVGNGAWLETGKKPERLERGHG